MRIDFFKLYCFLSPSEKNFCVHQSADMEPVTNHLERISNGPSKFIISSTMQRRNPPPLLLRLLSRQGRLILIYPSLVNVLRFRMMQQMMMWQQLLLPRKSPMQFLTHRTKILLGLFMEIDKLYAGHAIGGK